MNNLNTSRIGLPLTEILIVAALIAIQVAIAMPGFLEARMRPEVTWATTGQRVIDSALERGFVDNEALLAASAPDAATTQPSILHNGRASERSFTPLFSREAIAGATEASSSHSLAQAFAVGHK